MLDQLMKMTTCERMGNPRFAALQLAIIVIKNSENKRRSGNRSAQKRPPNAKHAQSDEELTVGLHVQSKIMAKPVRRLRTIPRTISTPSHVQIEKSKHRRPPSLLRNTNSTTPQTLSQKDRPPTRKARPSRQEPIHQRPRPSALLHRKRRAEHLARKLQRQQRRRRHTTHQRHKLPLHTPQERKRDRHEIQAETPQPQSNHDE